MNKTKGRTITATVPAWLPGHNSPESLLGDDLDAVNALSFVSYDMKASGYTLVGEAQITVHIQGEDKLIEAKVETLRAEKTKVLAEAERKSTEIERQIQTLLAITYDK